MDDTWFNVQKGALFECVAVALRENALTNRANLPPFQLPGVARQIVGGLVDFAASRGVGEAAKLGGEIGRQGLSLASLQALSHALIGRIQAEQAGEGPLLVVVEYMNVLTRELVEAHFQELRQQRDDMHVTLDEANRSREAQMRQLIHELSTPIMPICAGVLATPLIGPIDGERARQIIERLLVAIAARRARVVIIDITGVPPMDRGAAAALIRVAPTARLLGAAVFLVGIRPEIARTLVELSIDMEGIVTLPDMGSGIEVALRRYGLAIREATPRSAQRGKVGATQGPMKKGTNA